jgi:hypothetical protein
MSIALFVSMRFEGLLRIKPRDVPYVHAALEMRGVRGLQTPSRLTP